MIILNICIIEPSQESKDDAKQNIKCVFANLCGNNFQIEEKKRTNNKRAEKISKLKKPLVKIEKPSRMIERRGQRDGCYSKY